MDVFYTEDESRLISWLDENVKKFLQGKNIAIKLHMGERKNPHHLKPGFVDKIVATLKMQGFKPFLFDSPVIYKSDRNTEEGYLALAKEKGFGDRCPIVVSDESTPVKMKNMTYDVCKALSDADCILVLTHVKGHMCSGFGGAIKNLGMGALSKESKGKIHEGGEPEYKDGCTECNACEEICPTGNVRFEDSQPYFDKTWCCGCSLCVQACPTGAIAAKKEEFDTLLSEGAAAAASTFKKAFYINVLSEITESCDCMSDPGEIICEDAGFLASADPVAIDAASIDIVKKKAGKDVFKETNKKDPMLHVKRAEMYRMGSCDYVITS